MFKTVLRVATLVLCAIIGFWAVGHGFALAASVGVLTHEEMLQYLVEVSVSIAGGICVMSVAVEQLNCWRTHHKEGGLI
jgi:ATP-dependent protease HslVU (ClpYQ) peptidase subunit